MTVPATQQTGTQLPGPYNWNGALQSPGEVLQAKMKHLEMIQSVITRMANNSFMVKGWCITLVSALLAFAVGKDGSPALIIVAALPVLMFWYLDGFFLQQERHFRNFYNLEITTKDVNFRISPETQATESVREVMKRPTLKAFYGGTLAIVIAIAILLFVIWLLSPAKPQEKPSAASASPSPTVATSNNSSPSSLPSPSTTIPAAK